MSDGVHRRRGPKDTAGHLGVTAGHLGVAAGHLGVAAGHSGVAAGHSGVAAGHPGITAGHSGVAAEHPEVAAEGYEDLTSVRPHGTARPTPPAESGEGEAPGEEAQDKETEADETGGDGTGGATPEPSPRFEVLTAYSSRLNGLARGWPEAAAQLFLSGPRLRLWVAAAGEPVPGGYALGLGPAKDVAAIDAALVRVGLAGRLSDDGRHYVIMGKRRLRRLAELVGERPGAAPEHAWPVAASA